MCARRKTKDIAQHRQPIYVFSLIGSIFTFYALFVLFVIFAVSAFFLTASLPDLLASEAPCILLAGVYLVFARAVSRVPVRVVEFYDDHMDCRGKGLNRRIGYDEIDNVTLKRLALKEILPMWSRRNQVMVHIRGESSPVRIAANPLVRRLHGDLLSWLTEKAKVSEKRDSRESS